MKTGSDGALARKEKQAGGVVDWLPLANRDKCLQKEDREWC